MSDVNSTSATESDNGDGCEVEDQAKNISATARLDWASILRINKLLLGLASAVLGGLVVICIASDQLRLRWNPFYPWLENWINEFVSSPAGDE